MNTVLEICDENYNAFFKDIFFSSQQEKDNATTEGGKSWSAAAAAAIDYNGRTTVCWDLSPISLPTSVLIQEYLSLINENKSNSSR